MLTIGLTGGIGSGKSTVAAIFREAGIPVLDADRIVHDVYAPGTAAHSAIVRDFGDKILGSDGTIDRKILGVQIFHNPDKRMRLERITHPEVEKKMREFVETCRKRRRSLCIIEAALIFEKNRGDLFDKVITVWAEKDSRVERLMKRDGLSAEEILSRIDAQLPLEEKVKMGDFAIDNSGSLEDTRKQVRALIDALGNA